MDARLIPLNAVIGLASPPSSSWPNSLHEAGYTLVALELALDTADGALVADAVAFAEDTNSFLVVEAKSGQNVELNQARRYGLVDTRQLVRHTGVRVARDQELSAEALYVCLADNVDRILHGLELADCSYPVIAVSDQQLTLYNAQSSEHLSEIFSDPIATSGWPPAIIIVDADSDQDEFKPIVARALTRELSLGTPSIIVPELAGRALPHLHIYGKHHRSRLVKKVERAAQQCCEAAPDILRFRPRTAARDYSIVDFIGSPEQADRRVRTQRYQALARRIGGMPTAAPTEIQPALFDSMNLGAELEALEESESDADGSEEGEA